jgi:hypothetical protein
MKSDEMTKALCEALKTNTNVVDLNLGNLDITDVGATHLGEALAVNRSVVNLVLEKNKLKQPGAAAIAHGLKTNNVVRSVNLLSQLDKFGDQTLDAWCPLLRPRVASALSGFPRAPRMHLRRLCRGRLEMFETNITLLKITWRLESRKSFALTKKISRNNEVPPCPCRSARPSHDAISALACLSLAVCVGRAGRPARHHGP